MTTHDKLAAAREEGRNQGLLEAAEVAFEHVDLFRTKSADRSYNEACYNIEQAILALITRGGEEQATKGDWIIRGDDGTHYPMAPTTFVNTYEVESARLLDADEREALVVAIGQASDPALTHEACERLADALLAAGWTRKREEG